MYERKSDVTEGEGEKKKRTWFVLSQFFSTSSCFEVTLRVNVYHFKNTELHLIPSFFKSKHLPIIVCITQATDAAGDESF